MKIKNRSRQRSYKLDGIGVGRIRTVPFCSDSAYDSDAYDPVKTRLSESQAEAEEPPNHNAGFILWIPLTTPTCNVVFTGVISVNGRNWNRSDSAYDSDFRFSLDRKRFDSDSDSDSVASENQP